MKIFSNLFKRTEKHEGLDKEIAELNSIRDEFEKMNELYKNSIKTRDFK